MKPITYRDAGVDIDAGNRTVQLMRAAVESTHGPEVLAGVGAFGGLFALGALPEAQPVLVASTDGVGTKTRIAAALDRYDSIGADLVNHCINDILVQGARPLFFLDYVAAARLDPGRIAAVVGGVAAACRDAGVALLGGETAEMPGVYVEGELDLAGTIVGVVARDDIIDGSTIAVGDVVLALRSSGLHTNCYSLARKIIEGQDLTTPHAALDGASLGDALLAIHRSYLGEFKALEAAGLRGAVAGLVHITGGGLIDNPPRVLPASVAMLLDETSWQSPPIFAWLCDKAGLADAERRRAFNCGVGMLVVVRQASADAAESALRAYATNAGGAAVARVGVIVDRDGGDAVRFVG